VRTLDEAEIGKLIREGRIDLADLEEDPPEETEPEDTTLKDGLKAIVTAIKGIEIPAPAKPEAPKVTVSVPARRPLDITVKVLTRDKNGYIESVSFKEAIA